MAMLITNFEFWPDRWWQEPYDDLGMSTPDFIEDTGQRLCAVSVSLSKKKPDDLKGYQDFHFKKYLRERILIDYGGESNIRFIESLLQFSNNPVGNLFNALKKYFPTILFAELSIERFTPTLAQDMYSDIVYGKKISIVQYRKTYGLTAQEDYVYLAPGLISSKMHQLFSECREQFGNKDLQLENAIKLGACFLARFLFIRPFENGNGRVGRLLLSYLLSRFTVIPVSLYWDKKSQDVYFKCVRQAMCLQTPCMLATLIAERVHKAMYYICTSLDIEY